MDRKNRQQRIILFAFLISIALHTLFLGLFIQRDIIVLKQAQTKEVEIQKLALKILENKTEDTRNTPRPYEIVENQNSNNLTPAETDLLSDHNSQARNPKKNDQITKNIPLSEGNTPLRNLSGLSQGGSNRFASTSKFTSKELTGGSYNAFKLSTQSDEESGDVSEKSMASAGGTNNFDQGRFSVEEVGDLTLSTYKWEWAPYVNAMKNKLQRVWFAPAAYYALGLIHGQTIIRYTIDRNGRLVEWEVLGHEGHESLKISSVEAVKALFPFLPLPDHFPDETLTITARLIYPDLRGGR